jgi:hypothetical protein
MTVPTLCHARLVQGDRYAAAERALDDEIEGA